MTASIVAPRWLGSFRVEFFDEGRHKIRYVDRENACRMLKKLRESVFAAQPDVVTSLGEIREGYLRCDTYDPTRRTPDTFQLFIDEVFFHWELLFP